MKNLGVDQSTYAPVELFIPGFPMVINPVTILSGIGAVVKNTVLGKILLGAASSAAKAGGNTGDGALTLDNSTPILAKAKAGVYTVRCIAAATDGGTFRVTDPDGNVLGDVAVGATFANKVKFSIADGATDFVVGDGFDITIAEGSKKYKPYDADNLDGSQYPDCISAEDADSTSADDTVSAYFTGNFNRAAIAGLDTAAEEALRSKGIYFSTIM